MNDGYMGNGKMQAEIHEYSNRAFALFCFFASEKGAAEKNEEDADLVPLMAGYAEMVQGLVGELKSLSDKLIRGLPSGPDPAWHSSYLIVITHIETLSDMVGVDEMACARDKVINARAELLRLQAGVKTNENQNTERD